jgi:hypothetical protein
MANVFQKKDDGDDVCLTDVKATLAQLVTRFSSSDQEVTFQKLIYRMPMNS